MSAIQPIVLWVHAFATVAMAGLIWFVQIVHYPLMAKVGREQWLTYEAHHVRRTGWVVAPLMLAEAATAAVLFVTPSFQAAPAVVIIGAALLAAIWGSTWLLQVPAHNALMQRHDPTRINTLVRTNWIRTIGWSGRGVIALWLLQAHSPVT